VCKCTMQPCTKVRRLVNCLQVNIVIRKRHELRSSLNVKFHQRCTFHEDRVSRGINSLRGCLLINSYLTCYTQLVKIQPLLLYTQICLYWNMSKLEYYLIRLITTLYYLFFFENGNPPFLNAN